jgi:hypothetical protein
VLSCHCCTLWILPLRSGVVAENIAPATASVQQVV